MKLRKLEIIGYKIFDKINFDFTDTTGKTIDFIILAGINGSGKTTVFELLRRIFSNNYWKQDFRKPFGNTDDRHNFDKSQLISLEIELTINERHILLKRLKEEYNRISIIKESKLDKKFNLAINSLINKISQNNNITVEYKRKNHKQPNLTNLDKPIINEDITDEFIIFDILGEEKIKKELNLKVCHIPDQVAINSINQFTDFQQVDTVIKNDDYGILRIIDLNKHKDWVKKFIVETIDKKVYQNRDIPPQKFIKEELDKINRILKSVNFNIKLTEIDTLNKSPLLETFSGKKILPEELSSGEKQLFYRTVYLNSLNLENSIIMADEPELSLHPKWQSSVANLYETIGNNNQVFLATHSPHIIAKAEPENVFLLKIENNKIVVKQPKYSKGHSINYVLSEIMDANYRDTKINNKVDRLLQLIRQGKHKSNEGEKLLKEIKKLSPESEERIEVEFSLERYNAIGK